MDDAPEEYGYMHEVCKSLGKIKLVFGFAVAGFGLMVLSFPFVPPGSATRVVVVLNLVVSGAFILVFGYVYRRCIRLQERLQEAYRADPEE